MKWSPQDIVALVLAIGVMGMLVSGTNFKFIWMTPDELEAARVGYTQEVTQFWKDIINVILGALAGYIAGRNGDGGRNKS